MLSSAMTTNIQLEKWASKLRIPLNGVYSKDLLYDHIPRPGAYIINMADSDEGVGTHWIAIFLANPRIAIYFDSFGIVPPNSVIDFARRFGAHNIIMSDKQIQNINSGYCGQYSLLFLYEMSRKPKRILWKSWFKRFVDEFRDA